MAAMQTFKAVTPNITQLQSGQIRLRSYSRVRNFLIFFLDCRFFVLPPAKGFVKQNKTMTENNKTLNCIWMSVYRLDIVAGQRKTLTRINPNSELCTLLHMRRAVNLHGRMWQNYLELFDIFWFPFVPVWGISHVRDCSLLLAGHVASRWCVGVEASEPCFPFGTAVFFERLLRTRKLRSGVVWDKSKDHCPSNYVSYQTMRPKKKKKEKEKAKLGLNADVL